MFSRKTAVEFAPKIQVSSAMADAMNEWFGLFYQQPKDDRIKGQAKTRFAKVLTSYMATLAVNELKISAGTGVRAEYINEQITRFVMPFLRVNTQLAGVGGEVILKPFVSGRNILCEAVTADRFYPERINAAGIAEVGFFTDFDTLGGKNVVRIERFDLKSEECT